MVVPVLVLVSTIGFDQIEGITPSSTKRPLRNQKFRTENLTGKRRKTRMRGEG
jgi:hypothetical protein